MTQDPFSRYRKSFTKGTILYKTGQVGEEVFFIQSGLVKLQVQRDQKVFIVAILQKGDFFGDIGLFEEEKRFTQAEVIRPADIIVIGRYDFERMLLNNNEIAIRIIKKYCLRMKHAFQHIITILSDDEKTRILNVIVELMQRFGVVNRDRTMITIPFNVRDLAGLAGANYATAQKMANDLIAGEMITMSADSLVILNKEKLFKFIEYFKWRKSIGR